MRVWLLILQMMGSQCQVLKNGCDVFSTGQNLRCRALNILKVVYKFSMETVRELQYARHEKMTEQVHRRLINCTPGNCAANRVARFQ